MTQHHERTTEPKPKTARTPGATILRVLRTVVLCAVLLERLSTLIEGFGSLLG